MQTMIDSRPANALAAAPWRVDSARSSIRFRVPHLWGLTTVTGHFERFEGTLRADESGDVHFLLAVDAASIATGNRRRDGHLRSGDFFNLREYPLVRFTSVRALVADGRLAGTGWLEAAGRYVAVPFDASVRRREEDVEIDVVALVDQRQLGMTWSPLGAVKAPVAISLDLVVRPL